MEYVLNFIENPETYNESILERQILVVRKEKPEWQKGRINLIGGKIEEGEYAETAAIRELKEETGLDATGFGAKVMGEIKGSFGTVHCCKLFVKETEINPGEDEIEGFAWIKWQSLGNSKYLMPNLKVIIPLMLADISGWTINDTESSVVGEPHTFQITI